jgi:hypothetical protein
MRRTAALALGLFVLPCAAWAQTTGSLSPLSIIAYYESSDGTNLQNPNSSATGTFQDLQSPAAPTWAQALQLCGCGTISQYPQAIDAPNSVQFAANAALYNAEGFQPWTVGDPQLAAAIQADGGPSAFATNLSTDPATYASVDTASGLAAYFAANQTGTGTATATCTNCNTIGGAAAAAGVTATSGSTFHAFSFLWSQYANTITQPLQQELTSIQTFVSPFLRSLLTLLLMIMGGMTMFARMRISDYAKKVLIICFVLPFVAVDSVWYETYVVNLFQSLPVALSNGITGINSTNPAAGFDIIVSSFGAHKVNITWSLLWGASDAEVDSFELAIVGFFATVFVACMFAVWFGSQVITQLLVVIGPLIFPALLFDRFESWFDRWISQLLKFAIVMMGALLISSIVQKIMVAAFAAIPAAGQPSTDADNSLNALGVLFVLALSVVIWPFVVQHIANATGAHAHDHTANALNAAGRGGRSLGRALT